MGLGWGGVPITFIYVHVSTHTEAVQTHRALGWGRAATCRLQSNINKNGKGWRTFACKDEPNERVHRRAKSACTDAALTSVDG